MNKSIRIFIDEEKKSIEFEKDGAIIDSKKFLKFDNDIKVKYIGDTLKKNNITSGLFYIDACIRWKDEKGMQGVTMNLLKYANTLVL